MAGRLMNVMSVCQKSVRSLLLSIECTSRRANSGGSTGWLSVNSPKRLANTIWLSSSRCWSGKNTTSRSSQTRADGGVDLVVEVARAVDAADLGADRGAQGPDVEVDAADRHGSHGASWPADAAGRRFTGRL